MSKLLAAVLCSAFAAHAEDQASRIFRQSERATYEPGKKYPPSVTVLVPTLGLTLAVRSLGVGAVPVDGANGLTSDHAMVSIAISNETQLRKAQYTTPNLSLGDEFARLSDEHGNVYKWVSMPVGVRVFGRPATDNESIYPGKTLGDVLVFEEPISAARKLTFSFPLSVLGGGGDRVLFELPCDGLLEELAGKRATSAKKAASKELRLARRREKDQADEKAEQERAAREHLALLAKVETGIRGLEWRMKPDAAVQAIPGLKHNTDSRGREENWYAFGTATIGGKQAPTVDLYFKDSQLFRFSVKSEMSRKEWTELVRAQLGAPTFEDRDRSKWENGASVVVVSDQPYSGGIEVTGEFLPLTRPWGWAP